MREPGAYIRIASIRSVHQDGVDSLAEFGGQDTLDALQGLIGSGHARCAAPRPDQTGTKHKRRQLIAGKHQRREVEVAT
jgi:hypothetical protein